MSDQLPTATRVTDPGIRALYRLENGGLVKGEWEAETKGRRGARRRIYHLTAKGVRELEKSRTQWREFSRIIGGIMGVPT